ncbi:MULTISPECIES: glutaminase B [Gammaproteobacteria]|uniref:glutaminase B n=1 Tax=Gammaproteobacteria TaxID=1236 RepID=UPI000DCFD1F3|nr:MULTISPECIES: glutaminase B [Gammaproteobacteria]RTE86404.1 glutaminase [Aliidiomarina sp. B3213]TCZ91752.1 glutaminase [Lysobacter sp. N42]
MEGTVVHPKRTQALLEKILENARALPNDGKLADYIPALAAVNPEHLGLAVVEINGDVHTAGDAYVPFSIQSISKIFSLIQAMQRLGDDLWQRVRMEPSGQAFNSIVQLEWEHGIPRNPFINAGALVVADVLTRHYSASRAAFIQFIRNLAQNDSVIADEEVWHSELEHGNRNAAMAYLMKSFSNIEAEVPDVLDHYFYQCAVSMNCVDLATSLSFLANRGVHPCTNETICDHRSTHRINALLSTSGMYDQSGEFAFTVGLPAKSGVGGGLVAIVPDYGVICAWSPKLNAFGNPHKGVYMVTQLAEELGLSVYS